MVMEVLKECPVLVPEYYRFTVDCSFTSHYFVAYQSVPSVPAPVPNFQVHQLSSPLDEARRRLS